TGGRIVEDLPEPGVSTAVARLAGLGRGEGARDYRLEHPAEGDHAVAAHHLEESGLVDHRHLRATGEEHPAGAPPESITDEVGTQRPEVLGAWHRFEQGESAAASRCACATGALDGSGDHSGGGDR